MIRWFSKIGRTLEVSCYIEFMLNTPALLPVCDKCRLQTCRPADLQTCRPADLQTCRLADLQTCRLADSTLTGLSQFILKIILCNLRLSTSCAVRLVCFKATWLLSRLSFRTTVKTCRPAYFRIFARLWNLTRIMC